MESLAEELDWVVKTLLDGKVQVIHSVGEYESLCSPKVTGDGSFKIPSFCAHQRACARKARTSVALARSIERVPSYFLPLVEQIGVYTERMGSCQSRAVFHWPAVGLRHGRPRHSAAVRRTGFFP